MNIEQLLKEAYMCGVNEAQIAEQMKGFEHDFNGMSESYANSKVKELIIPRVSNWVAISSTEQPEIMTDVMVKYKDGRKEVAFFDGDKRFYIEKDDRDVTETIVEWHKLP